MSRHEMKSTLDFLYSLHKFGMKLGLRNIRYLLKSVGNPYKIFPSIHIAGTNGKGSTASMTAAIFSAAGYKVGLYTSPHLIRFNERIRINGKMISDEAIIRYTHQLKPFIQHSSATFFEATTAMAFKYFAEEHVDIAIVETGLGGRLDSTNVIKPLVSGITSIGKDHTEQLGNTLAAIAFEKAGIIKQHVPVVIGKISGQAYKVITKVSAVKGAPLINASEISLPNSLKLELKGQHQIGNAKTAVAIATVASKKFVLGDKAVRLGLEQTSRFTGLRGRMETVQSNPKIVFDVAHNFAGIKTVVSELKTLPAKKIIVVFAVMKDKDYKAMLYELKKLHPIIIATQPEMERALPSAELFQLCKKMKFKSFHASTISQAIAQGKQLSSKKTLLLVTGSHYLVGEALKSLRQF